MFLAALALLSVSGIARELYAMPLLAPLAVLAVPGVLTLRRGAANAFWWFALLFAGFMALVGWFYWMAMDLGFPRAPAPSPDAHAARLSVPRSIYSGFRGLALTLFWIWVLTRLQRSPERPLIAHAVGMTLIWGLGADRSSWSTRTPARATGRW